MRDKFKIINPIAKTICFIVSSSVLFKLKDDQEPFHRNMSIYRSILTSCLILIKKTNTIQSRLTTLSLWNKNSGCVLFENDFKATSDNPSPKIQKIIKFLPITVHREQPAYYSSYSYQWCRGCHQRKTRSMRSPNHYHG